MKPEYYAYVCLTCFKSFIILRVEKEEKALLTCPHCRAVYLKKTGAYDDLKKCMERIPYLEK